MSMNYLLITTNAAAMSLISMLHLPSSNGLKNIVLAGMEIVSTVPVERGGDVKESGARLALHYILMSILLQNKV